VRAGGAASDEMQRKGGRRAPARRAVRRRPLPRVLQRVVAVRQCLLVDLDADVLAAELLREREARARACEGSSRCLATGRTPQ